MSLLWWQNGRDIDWFSTNIEKWIKPDHPSSNCQSSEHSGRYSKLKSCRLSKTCQTMMYVPQNQRIEQSYEDQLAMYQDNRPYKYSRRQEHYNNNYNYIRTTARRAYYKPETSEIVLADEYDKIQNIKLQNKTKNINYLMLLRQFLNQEESRSTNQTHVENIKNIKTYLNDNIEKYEQTDQVMTLKQFLQEGIQKNGAENLVSLKDFLHESPENKYAEQNKQAKQEPSRKNADIRAATTNPFVVNGTLATAPIEYSFDLSSDSWLKNRATSFRENLTNTEELTLAQFLQEKLDTESSVKSKSTNPFISQKYIIQNPNNPFLNQIENEKYNQDDCEDLTFEEFLRERQNICRKIENCPPHIQISTDHNCTDRKKAQIDINFALNSLTPANAKTNQIVNEIKNSKKLAKNFLKKEQFEKTSLEDEDKISFDNFLKERSLPRENFEKSMNIRTDTKAMTLEEFLNDKSILEIECNQNKPKKEFLKTTERKSLKLSKSFNDRTNQIKENILKKLTRNDSFNQPSKKTITDQIEPKKKEIVEQDEQEHKITLYEFLKEEDTERKKENINKEIDNDLKNMKLRTNYNDNTFYEIIENNRGKQTPEIKLNDNFIQIETEIMPSLKFSQYENNKQVYLCENRISLSGKIINPHCNQFLNNQNSVDNIEFIDRSFDYHRRVQQENSNNNTPHFESRLFNSMRCGRKSKAKIHSPTIGRNVEQGIYGPVWPSVLLTYDKVISPVKVGVCRNESYA